MNFINRKRECDSFRDNYEQNIRNNINQVYIIEADHGVGKSEFIKEVSKYFSHYPIEIFPFGDTEELSVFKRMILELDKISDEYGFDDFKTFYRKKSNNAKALQLLLKITAIFGQIWAKSKECDVDFISLTEDSKESEKFILNAQVENLFEYSKYVFSTVHMHVVFHHTLVIDAGSLDLLSKLIVNSKGSVFIFESNSNQTSSKIEQYLKNSHSIFMKKYLLNKLSDSHIENYIKQLVNELKLEADYINSSILKESIEKGDLAEISSILKDFNNRLKKDISTKIRSTKEIVQSLTKQQNTLLILISYANGKLNTAELKEVINELNSGFNMSNLDLLLEKKLIEKNDEYVLILPFVHKILNEKEYMPNLKYAVASALNKNLNKKLSQAYNNRYVDILTEYYLNNKQFSQLKFLLKQISRRIKNFNTQAERIDYFKKFCKNRMELYKKDKDFAMLFAKMAYDTNLYFEAMDFINLINNMDDDTIFMKALILNRCEKFNESKIYIKSKLNKSSPIYFKLSLLLMMNLIQLNEYNDAKNIFINLKSYEQEPLYPYLIRLSNVFYDDYLKRLEVVQSITPQIYDNNNECSGLHAIYLAYLYSLTEQPNQAEKSLLEARNFFGDNLIYNHMILHNEAIIKFHNNEIDEEIPVLLNNAKITAYDEYDQFAINNNLLVYYILSDNISNIECQKIVQELERMLEHTNFKRFVDKIYYNLYIYYVKMYSYEKSEYYKTKLSKENAKYDGIYKYKLMYETSWKLPINQKN